METIQEGNTHPDYRYTMTENTVDRMLNITIEIANRNNCRLSFNILTRHYKVEKGRALIYKGLNKQHAINAYNINIT